MKEILKTNQFWKKNHLLGGAGGKGTWGKLGCELELPWIDPNDPNYESDSEKADSPKEINGKKSLVDCKPLVPEMSEEDVRKAVEPLILEYFENSDSMEVLFTLQVKKSNIYFNYFSHEVWFHKRDLAEYASVPFYSHTQI